MSISPTRRAKENREMMRRLRDWLVETNSDVFVPIQSANAVNFVEIPDSYTEARTAL